ncbi:hypothetical protein GCM10027447_38870 [Glycomyces halotolerans]
MVVGPDLLLGLGVAGIELPLGDQAVMATYAAAQLLIVTGCVRRLPSERASVRTERPETSKG